jgi:hypothetical protein
MALTGEPYEQSDALAFGAGLKMQALERRTGGPNVARVALVGLHANQPGWILVAANFPDDMPYAVAALLEFDAQADTIRSPGFHKVGHYSSPSATRTSPFAFHFR